LVSVRPFLLVLAFGLRIGFMDELAGASASSAAMISSYTSALTIPSITGCDCFSCMIFRITSIAFVGRSHAPVRQ
jgi:inner membrane protein involved in colicin E2 resistance